MPARPQPFDRDTIEKAFERLGELAVAAGKIVEISVYGGAALILTLEARPATRDVDAVFDADRAFIRSSFRPLSIAEIAQRAAAGDQNFDLAVREFIDSWQSMPAGSRAESLAEEPVRVGR